MKFYSSDIHYSMAPPFMDFKDSLIPKQHFCIQELAGWTYGIVTNSLGTHHTTIYVSVLLVYQQQQDCLLKLLAAADSPFSRPSFHYNVEQEGTQNWSFVDSY